MGSIPWGVLSAQSFAGWSLESEALLPEWSTWLLICTCVGTWVGPGASVHGEGGGEGWHLSLCEVGWWRVWWAGLPSLSPHREGFGGKGAGCVLRDLPGLHSAHVPGLRAHHLPAVPVMPSFGIILGGLPCQSVSCQALTLPRGSHGGLQAITVPRA